jgi:hypothetical protein
MLDWVEPELVSLNSGRSKHFGTVGGPFGWQDLGAVGVHLFLG